MQWERALAGISRAQSVDETAITQKLDPVPRRDRWLVRSEMVWNRWGQPAYEADPRRDLDVMAAMVEARYKLWPGLYVAGLPRCRLFVDGRSERFERLLSDQLTPADLA